MNKLNLEEFSSRLGLPSKPDVKLNNEKKKEDIEKENDNEDEDELKISDILEEKNNDVKKNNELDEFDSNSDISEDDEIGFKVPLEEIKSLLEDKKKKKKNTKIDKYIDRPENLTISNKIVNVNFNAIEDNPNIIENLNNKDDDNFFIFSRKDHDIDMKNFQKYQKKNVKSKKSENVEHFFIINGKKVSKFDIIAQKLKTEYNKNNKNNLKEQYDHFKFIQKKIEEEDPIDKIKNKERLRVKKKKLLLQSQEDEMIQEIIQDAEEKIKKKKSVQDVLNDLEETQFTQKKNKDKLDEDYKKKIERIDKEKEEIKKKLEIKRKRKDKDKRLESNKKIKLNEEDIKLQEDVALKILDNL
jgi:hypothetical protein